MEYQIFLGCTIPVRQVNYEISARKVASALDIELIDRDFGCCGFPVEGIDEVKALGMSSINILKAAEMQEPLVTLCSACGEMLSKTKHVLSDTHTLKKVNKILNTVEQEYKGEKPKILHFARMLYEDYGVEEIKKKIVNPLNLKIATHPGCHYVRPKELFQEFDDPEFPVSLDRLVEATGAEAVDYIGKTDCCGGGLLAVNENISKAMTAKKLNTLSNKADAIVLACPFCGIMFDKYQKTLEEELEKQYDLPVLYITQLIGLALGIDPNELGFDVNTVSVNKILEKVI